METIPYTKNEVIKRFLTELRSQCKHYHDWAEDVDKLDRFLANAHQTIEFGYNTWIPDGPAYRATCSEDGLRQRNPVEGAEDMGQRTLNKPEARRAAELIDKQSSGTHTSLAEYKELFQLLQKAKNDPLVQSDKRKLEGAERWLSFLHNAIMLLEVLEEPVINEDKLVDAITEFATKERKHQ